MTEPAARSTCGQAFDRAARRERDAIVVHERAAAMQEVTAVMLADAALVAVDFTHADGLRGRTALGRDLAVVARGRAAGVRDRLTAEGIADAG
jgi:hypothetical protein